MSLIRLTLFSCLIIAFCLPLQAQTQDQLLSQAKDPLDLVVTGDFSREVSVVVDDAGGAISVTTPAGDAISLTIPPGALAFPTRISLVPISNTAGLPDGSGPINGVMMLPDGLELAQTATLEIRPTKPIPQANRLHWGFYGEGKDAYLHIPVQNTDAILIPIDHFSGAGVSAADRANLQLDRWQQTKLQDRIGTQIAELMREAKASGEFPHPSYLRATDMMGGELTRTMMVGWRKLTERPAADCETLETATRSLMAIERLRENAGLVESFEQTDVIAQLFDRYWAVCFPEKVRICQSTGDLPILPVFGINFERQKQLMSMRSYESVDAARFAQLRAAIEACGRYKLSITANGQWQDPSEVKGRLEFKVDVPIRVKFKSTEGFFFRLIGEAGPTDVSVSFVDTACWRFKGHSTSQMMLAEVTEIEFFKDESHRPLRMAAKFQGPEILADISCEGHSMKAPISPMVWAVAHKAELKGMVFTLTKFLPGDYPRIFKVDWTGTGTDDGLQANDSSKLVLEHLGG